MPRVLFDIDFSNQSFNNSADESDWILSPANTLIVPETATYTARDTNVYVLNCNKIYGNSGTIGNLCFVSRKSRVIKEYELEIEFVNRNQAKAITINSTVTFNERELVVDGTRHTIGSYFYSNDYHKYKLRREGTNLYCYIDNNLVYTYDDTAEKCLLQGKLNFVGLISSSYISSFVAQYVKATELTVTPYITASSDQITAGDSVQLTVNGSAVSYLWSNGETTASIIVEPTATTIYTCDVTTADDQITLSKTIRVSASVVYGTRGAVDDDTLFLINFADGKLNVLKGTLINANCIDDPYYTEHLEVDGVSVVNGMPWNDSNKTLYTRVYPPFFDNSFWHNATLPLDLTFEWTLYTPEANANGCYWERFPLYLGIRNTSNGMPQKNGSINYGTVNISGYHATDAPKSDGSQMMWILSRSNSDCNVIYQAKERLPWLASMIIGNGWSAQGWHHIAMELTFYEWNSKVCSDVVMYIDGEQIKTWHQEWTTNNFSNRFSFNEEWFTFMTESRTSSVHHNWYMSEMCITKGRKYNGTFELPSNFYKNYITLANDVLPEKNPEPNFMELAIVNAQGTDAPVMAIKIDCESLSKPICFAQSYHDFVARDDQGELQEFQSSGIQINLPERTNQSGSALSFGVGSISGEVMELCNTVMSGAVPCYLTLLEYLPFDTSREYDGDTAVSPIYTLKLFVTSCQITTKGATITAGWHDTLNAKFPYKRYTAKQFKGLRYVC
jgi:hypothetical protein